jgi:ribosomal protein S12 methylthiotransferase accessory factor
MTSSAVSFPDCIRFRNTEHRGVKRFWRGTQRSISPEETLERIRPCFPKAGVTRMANITGLDRIGIPTCLAIRPNSRTLSNSAGKGFTLEAALASGAMEAIELYHAEECSLPGFRAPYKEIPEQYGRIPLEDFPLVRYAPFSEHWPFLWTTGWDILNQCEVAVPTAVISMGMGPQTLHELFAFQITSNGLASGNDFLEAVNAALFEVIERDAVTSHRVRWDATGEHPPAVRLDTIEHPLVLELIERLKASGMALVLFDCSVDTEIPVYMAFIVDLLWCNVGVFKGYGAHLDPEIAMIRAITEAVQGRAVYIAGSRDDLFRHNEVHLKHDMNDYAAQRMLETLAPTVDAHVRRSEATPTFEGDTLKALAKLQRVGLKQAIVVDLSRSDFPIHVVKVIVPGLEGYMFDFYTPGHRALAFAQRGEV